MANQIQPIVLDKLIPHPGNPNRMSKANFAKLVRNIQRTSRYEPLVVRPASERQDCFQIINGHHRCRALRELGYKTVDVVVWDIDDKDADILLATLNHLGGSDVLEKKLALLKRLNQRMQTRELAKLLPHTAKQIERLANLKGPAHPDHNSKLKTQNLILANPFVFFVNDQQRKIIDKAVSVAMSKVEARNKAMKRTAALTYIAQRFITTVNL